MWHVFKKHDEKVVVASSMELNTKALSCSGWEVRRKHLSFLIFCIGFQTEFFEILLFCSVKKAVLLSTMRVICYILCS